MRHCWASRAVRLAFIFSRRLDRWLLLASSSSILSRADLSCSGERRRERWKARERERVGGEKERKTGEKEKRVRRTKRERGKDEGREREGTTTKIRKA